MSGTYARWIDRWERRLASRDSNRVLRPFEWGLDWLGIPDGDPPDVRAKVLEYAAGSTRDSEAFFAHRTPAGFKLDGHHLTFTSALSSPYPENNTVHAEFFPCHRARGRAVVVLPQWNADARSHFGLCRLINRFGVAALRMSLAYHDLRMPAETQRADYHVSSNVGRTIHAGRQSVLDVRACLDWLEIQGYNKLAVLGTSLGSCIAFIAAVHDSRVHVAVLNHVSTWFGDVVWTGLSTQHVRRGLESGVTREDLRRMWAPISPASYWSRLRGRELNSLLIWARYDTTFLPEFSREVIRVFDECGAPHQVLTLPCGHYTTGQAPFKFLDGLAMSRFLSAHMKP
jgi:hypothetical protein